MSNDNWKEIWESDIAFQEHLRSSIQYPKWSDPLSRFLIVPIDLVVAANGNLASFNYATNPIKIGEKYKYTKNAEFVNIAFQIISTFNNWVPNKIDGIYLETKKYLNIRFCYHEQIFKDHSIVLNPDYRPNYPNKNRAYEYTIQGKYGCDGIVEFLVIVDKNGSLIALECLNANGKTNCQVAEHQLLKLGKWEPAMHQNKKVSTQMEITVYT